ncbi:hypothetical protein [Deinococcus peraridilitoris]|uniref:Uncharacterized protein n=1 Tax=Deinococcus peraridilitoris (strain DSM 19664 / LMG 22246 / CIP 109416 / KR-200) TaxID=937777 RepID=L0A187_DEIPD|nr:hypothetical protein [Deinococcus peraridilitoris]AFZ66780.1 hypothetical protein Deipe_1230 [Deinococcus peraridilitoris DSM 19664]
MQDEVHHVEGLEIEEDIRTQQRVWTVQRVLWGLALLMALAALLGLFGGSGPLNSAIIDGADANIQVKYPRFGRLDAEMPIRVTLQPRPGQDEARVWISREYLDAVDLETIRPEPSAQESRADGVTYVFDWPDADQPTTVTFFVQPVRWGRVTGRVGLPEETTLDVSHLVYP